MVTKGYRKGVYERVTFETVVCDEAMRLTSENGYARAASKKKRKISNTGLGSQRMIFHSMKLIA